jgi:hypothetical protein
MRHLPLVAAALLVTVAAARAESLAELLDAIAVNARFEPAARADVRIDCSAGCAAAGKRAILVGRGDRVYLEVENGPRVLVGLGEMQVAPGGKPADRGMAVAGTDLALEDLLVFDPHALAYPMISDDGPAGVVVTSAPAGASSYALLVYTLERTRRAIVKTQYYQGSVGNLTKLRRDTSLVQQDGHWRPTEVTIDNLRAGTSTHLRLAWRAAGDVPARLFEPDGLAQPSGLVFP